MYLTRHHTAAGPRWALDGFFLPPSLSLSTLLELPRSAMHDLLKVLPQDEAGTGTLLPPLDPSHEVWAAGVTYLRSREARRAESSVADIYERVYDAPRPELFFKTIGWRVVGHGMPIRVRRDSRWNVPEPELTLVVNSRREIVGFCAGNDVSSRDIEGENPLYLPQAKIYDGSCALGPGILLVKDPSQGAGSPPDGDLRQSKIPVRGELADLDIGLEVQREGRVLFRGETSVARMKRDLQELVDYLGRELSFPHGAFLMTGTGIVPGEDFSLAAGDVVCIRIGSLSLENPVT